jgi:hypothetical protein
MRFMGVVVLVLYQKNALAYLDPGTGSMIIQSIIAGVAAGLYFISTSYERIKIFISEKIFKNK